MAKVMVVDDERDARNLIKTILKLDDYHVITTKSGEECISKLARENVDLIILDIRMPGIGGLETQKRLKTNPNTKGIPIIIVTAKYDPMDKAITRHKGDAAAYITKPFEKNELLRVVRRVLLR